MNIQLNGSVFTCKESTKTLSNLLEELNLLGALRIIELNGEIITKENYPNQKIKENDQIEIIQFMGGGK